MTVFVGPGIGTNEANEPRVVQEAGENWACPLLLPSYRLVNSSNTDQAADFDRVRHGTFGVTVCA